MTPEEKQTEQRVVSIDDFFELVMAELSDAELGVETKATELAAARERLAAARGKMDLLGSMQRAIMGGKR